MPSYLRPQELFEQLYASTPRALSCVAETVEDWQEWRARARRRLRELLVLPEERTDLQPELLSSQQREGYRLEKWLLQTQPYVSAPVFVLVPDGLTGRAPVVLASHGHGHGVREILGEPVCDEETERIRDLNYDYARQAALRGYLVVAPERAALGERYDPPDLDGTGPSCGCRRSAWWAAMQGRTLLGLRVWDAMRCLDFAETRPEADATRMGMIGLSGGGLATAFTSALEDRLAAVIVSGYFCQWRTSILAMDHCECNYVPGILRHFECADLAGMIAPKPLLIEAGAQDPIFPLPGVKEAYACAERLYGVLGIADRLELDVFEGEHMWHGVRAWEFLQKWLR